MSCGKYIYIAGGLTVISIYRTPLNGILGMSNLLAEEQLTSEQKASITTIHECGQALLKMVDDVLELTQLEAGAFMMKPLSMNLVDIMNSCCSIYRPAAISKALQLNVNIDNAIPNELISDPAKIERIICIFLDNAVKVRIHLQQIPLMEPPSLQKQARSFCPPI
jgi:signal transduction histidine kinase